MEVVKMVPISEYVALKMEVQRLNSLVEELAGKLKSETNILSDKAHEKFIFIKSKGCSRMVHIADIVMIKAESNYSTIFLITGDSIFTSKTLKYWQDKCQNGYFQRVHKSFLINNRCIMTLESKSKTITLLGNFKAQFSMNIQDISDGSVLIK